MLKFIPQKVFCDKSRTRFETQKLAQNRIEFLEGGKVAYTYISKEDEEKYEEGHTTEFTLCDVSEKYIPDSPDEIDEKNKNNNTKEQNKNNEKTKTNENVKQNKEDTIKASKPTINTKRNIRQQLKARRINNEHDKIFRTVLDKKQTYQNF